MSEITFDDERDLLTFRYTEPSTWWVSVPREQKGTAFTLEDGCAYCETLAARGPAEMKSARAQATPQRYAQGWKTSVIRDADGAMVGQTCKRSLAYGALPSFFTWHGVSTFASNIYFRRPDCYERDRPLFKKYVPLCRTLSEAGWQPVNGLLASDNPQVITEQFGDIYATVFNLSDKPQTVRLKVLPPSVATLEERVAESTQTVSAGVLTLTLPPETVRVFRFK